MIATIFKKTFFGIDSHTAVVTHMLAASGSHIEKRGLTAVRITDESDTDFLSSLICKRRHLSFYVFVISLDCRQGLTFCQKFLCLSLTDDFNLRGLLTAQGNLVSDDLILNRIPQRSIKDHLDLIASDKAHFPDSLSETTVARNLYDHATLTCT